MSAEAEVVVSLVARCRAGDQEAWAELVRMYSRYVFAICQQGFRLSDADAEDVFQDVFVRVYEHLDTIRDDASLRAWIGQVTRRLCLDRLRAAKRAPTMEDEWEAADPDDALERVELAMDVDRMMTDLPESCADILDRFFRRDESYAVIGTALSIPAGTIASRISRCLSRLRELMEGRPRSSGASGET
jgi:RNA polymerase sigma-70 factor (ECF subfamily)